MERRIERIAWRRPDANAFTDITDALSDAAVSATPHPDDEIDRPKGYSLKLTLRDDSTDLAEDLQAALMDLDPALVTLTLEDADAPIETVPVSVSKVPYPGEQNVAELGVTPEGHAAFHPYF
jgi:hypothetical protein